MAEEVPVPARVVLDWLRSDATLLAYGPIATEIKVTDGVPVVPWTLVQLVAGPDTTSDLPEIVATVQVDVYAGGNDKVTAQNMATRVQWLAANTARYVSAGGTLRGATVAGIRDSSEQETDRSRFTIDLLCTVHRPT